MLDGESGGRNWDESCRYGAYEIRVDDLRGEAVAGLLQAHLEDMVAISPEDGVHALDLEKLRGREITFWCAWSGDELAGCGALKALGEDHGEVKSMRTAAGYLRQGVARAILTHVIAVARRRGYRRLSLETGATDAFAPAHALYSGFGFKDVGPFGDYADVPFSRFMALDLE